MKEYKKVIYVLINYCSVVSMIWIMSLSIYSPVLQGKNKKEFKHDGDVVSESVKKASLSESIKKIPSFKSVNKKPANKSPKKVEISKGDKDENNIVKIKSLLQSELLIKSALADDISSSIYYHTLNTPISSELVVAVMKIESHGRHRAVSPAGAMGLMQVMPFWKKVLKMENADLFDVDTNIKMGVYVLNRYMNRYKKVEKALAAYNGSLGSNRYPNKVLKIYKKIAGKVSNEI